MHFFSEHRLLHYIKPTDQTKYSSRVAEANAEAQAQTHQQALSDLQADAAKKMAEQGQTQGAVYYQQQAQNLNPQPQPLVDPQGNPTSAGVLNQAQTIANTPNAVNYNTQTGVTTDLGFKDVKSGAMGQQGATGINPVSDAVKAVDEKYGAMGGRGEQFDPRVYQAERSAAATIAAEDERSKTATSEREAARTGRNAASTAAGTKKNEPIQDTSRMDSISTMLDGIITATGDPMGPVYKEMMMQDLQDMEDAKQNAALNREASIERAEDKNDAVQDLLDKYVKIHRENNDKYTAILDETRDSQQQYLAEQEQRDQDRLAWEGDKEVQKLTKQKTAQLLSQSIQNALGGGAFSGAANEQLASTEREWDTAISNLAKEFSFKKADVSAFYTQKYVDTNNQFNLDIFNAAKTLDEKIEGYSLQGFNSLQAMEDAKTTANNDYRKEIDTAKKDYSTKIQGYVKEIQATAKEYRIEERDKKQQTKTDAMALWEKTIATTNDPIVRANVIKYLGKSGWDTSLFDPNADPLLNSAASKKEDTENQMTEAYGKFIDEDTSQDMVSILRASTLDLKSDKRVESAVEEGLALLESGNVKGFKSLVLQNARASMAAPEAAEVTAREDIVNATSRVKEVLDQLEKDDFGYWKAVTEGKKKLIDLDKDPKFTGVKAAMQFAQSQLRNKLFGANLTDTEASLANDFLLNFNEDEVGTLIQKSIELNKSIDDSLDVRYDFILGDGVYRDFIRNGTTTNEIQSEPEGVLQGDAANDWLRTGGQSSSSSSSSSVPPPKISRITSKDLTVASVGGREVKAQPYIISSLQKADQEFFAATGRHIQVNDHYRSPQQQAALYAKSQRGEIGRAAPPGKSFHEMGLALDIANWQDAAPYLKKYGLVNGLKNDMGHFSFGELNPDAIAHFDGDGHYHNTI